MEASGFRKGQDHRFSVKWNIAELDKSFAWKFTVPRCRGGMSRALATSSFLASLDWKAQHAPQNMLLEFCKLQWHLTNPVRGMKTVSIIPCRNLVAYLQLRPFGQFFGQRIVYMYKMCPVWKYDQISSLMNVKRWLERLVKTTMRNTWPGLLA